mmetsp:Transcript_909/g.1719  ORF Transcript_909/g.1719 Transcript_909/m.1719 type:complete len:220 (-) Transcript_909:769-1428(-)
MRQQVHDHLAHGGSHGRRDFLECVFVVVVVVGAVVVQQVVVVGSDKGRIRGRRCRGGIVDGVVVVGGHHHRNHHQQHHQQHGSDPAPQEPQQHPFSFLPSLRWVDVVVVGGVVAATVVRVRNDDPVHGHHHRPLGMRWRLACFRPCPFVLLLPYPPAHGGAVPLARNRRGRHGSAGSLHHRTKQLVVRARGGSRSRSGGSSRSDHRTRSTPRWWRGGGR